MSESQDRHVSILVVSSSDKLNTFLQKSLPQYTGTTPKICSSGASARRELNSSEYDTVIINIPLPDETATDLAIYVSETYKSGVVLISPADKYYDILERVTDNGILTLSKPVNIRLIMHSIRFISAIRARYSGAEKKVSSLEEKMEEIRIVNRAKLILIEKDHMTEDDAHRYIGKQAMDRGLTRLAVANEIIETV